MGKCLRLPVASPMITKALGEFYILTRKCKFYVRRLRALKNLLDLNLLNGSAGPCNWKSFAMFKDIK